MSSRLLPYLAFSLAAAHLFTASTSAQQDYINHYDVYTGFADIDSPALGLNEQGFTHRSASILAGGSRLAGITASPPARRSLLLTYSRQLSRPRSRPLRRSSSRLDYCRPATAWPSRPTRRLRPLPSARSSPVVITQSSRSLPVHRSGPCVSEPCRIPPTGSRRSSSPS